MASLLTIFSPLLLLRHSAWVQVYKFTHRLYILNLATTTRPLLLDHCTTDEYCGRLGRASQTASIYWHASLE